MRDLLAIDATTDGYSEETEILVVGSVEEWNQSHNLLAPPPNVSCVAFPQVTEALVDHLQPETVISPALARDFDCFDLALVLNDLDFHGAYRASAVWLPKPEVVVAEIRQLCPQLDFEIVTER